MYNHVRTTTVFHSLPHLNMGDISFVLRFFKESDLFLHFNVDVLTFVVRELAKSAMGVCVQRNSLNSYVFWSSCLLLLSQGW